MSLDKLKWLAVDFDGTLAESVWSPERPGPDIGDPIHYNLDQVEELSAKGWKIVIHTARGWEHYEAIEAWLQEWTVPYDKIVCGKLLAHRYIDDKAIRAQSINWADQL